MTKLDPHLTTGGLAVRDLAVRFGETRAVDAATFHVEPGEIVALLGPSGCGKSTLLRAIIGLQPYERGHVYWDGEEIDTVPVHLRGFGLMFQDGQLFPHRNVARNVEYGLKGSGLNKNQVKERVAQLLEMVGLSGFGDRQIANLSGGERQRVALARALAPEPRLLLLDEPLSALDRDLRDRLAVDLRDVLRKTETTAIFVTHDHDEAFTIADRIAVMRAGKILQIGTPQQVWREPVTKEVAHFLGYRWFDKGPKGELALHAGSFILVEPAILGDSAAAGSADSEQELPVYSGRIVGQRGAYREGHIIAVDTRQLGVVEVRVPGITAPGSGTEVQLRLRPDAVGVISV